MEIPLYEKEEMEYLIEKKKEITSKIKQLAKLKYLNPND